MGYKMKGSSFYGKDCMCNADSSKSPLKKKGGYHKGQVSDAKKEEMNDNIYMGKGPAKPKSVVSARPNTKNTDETLMAADGSTSTAPTFSDFIYGEKNNRKDPDTKRAKKVNKKLLGK